MKVSVEFVEGAAPCVEKPKSGVYEKVGAIYVETWMCWEVVVSGKRDELHYVNSYAFKTKPTQRMIRKIKKGVWIN